MPNYAAKGEYHAMKEQAADAGHRRFALANNLAGDLRRYAEGAQNAKSVAEFRAALDEIEAAERELAAAVERMNQAADLCGERRIDVLEVLRPFAR
jgi:hypothetical protein